MTPSRIYFSFSLIYLFSFYSLGACYAVNTWLGKPQDFCQFRGERSFPQLNLSVECPKGFVYIFIRGVPRSTCIWRPKVELVVFCFYFIFLLLGGDDLEPFCVFIFLCLFYLNSNILKVDQIKCATVLVGGLGECLIPSPRVK